MNLAVRQEKTLFKVNMVLASLAWVAFTIGTFGLLIPYVLGGVVFYFFAQSLLIAHLKGNSVLVDAEQFPDLHARIQAACNKLNMAMPAVYVMNGNGILNAFATQFLKRKYMVLYSDVVDSLEDRPGSLSFYIGHELGHIHRNHIRWGTYFMPLYLFPLLMPAYRRACETTCDQYGAFCSESPEDAVRALAVLAAGKKRWQSVSSARFISQIAETGEFWMSFHEITSTYPWLSKRIAMVQNKNAEKEFPARSVLAWIMGFFCPGFISGAFLPLVLMYLSFVVVGLGIVTKARTELAKGTNTSMQQSGDSDSDS